MGDLGSWPLGGERGVWATMGECLAHGLARVPVRGASHANALGNALHSRFPVVACECGSVKNKHACIVVRKHVCFRAQCRSCLVLIVAGDGVPCGARLFVLSDLNKILTLSRPNSWTPSNTWSQLLFPFWLKNLEFQPSHHSLQLRVRRLPQEGSPSWGKRQLSEIRNKNRSY